MNLKINDFEFYPEEIKASQTLKSGGYDVTFEKAKSML